MSFIPERVWLSSSDPSNPPPPTELRVANMSFGPGRVVSARLQWSMPADLDVPVHHYKVSWSWSHAGQFAASSVNKRRKTVQQVIFVLCMTINMCIAYTHRPKVAYAGGLLCIHGVSSRVNLTVLRFLHFWLSLLALQTAHYTDSS